MILLLEFQAGLNARDNPGKTIVIRADFEKPIGEMKPVWAFWGHDELNYTYMGDGKKLLSELAELSPVPVYLRVHNLLVTGEESYGLKWGLTNIYTENEKGEPVYDWTIIDKILDTGRGQQKST